MTAIRVVGLAKTFGHAAAVDDVSFEVASGSLVTLLGPSGCGKTTTLRMIAGLERPSAGEVYVGDRLLTSTERGVFLPPDRRRMGMVFQSYAIWPHMTVFDNVAFPLQSARIPAADIREKVMAMLRSLGLEGLHDRPAPLLSGGQQQRVALGRALVADPDVLLLDEPFSNLDARLREEMRFELKEVQARLGITTLFVTHDQAEAMILSDRVLVMNAGRVAQEGTPRLIYERPGTQFVMDFLGQVDHVDARVALGEDGALVARPDGVDGTAILLSREHPWRVGEDVVLAFRSTAVEVHDAASRNDGAGWRGVVQSSVYMGERVEYIVKLGNGQVRAFGPVDDVLGKGTAVWVTVPTGAIKAWPAQRGGPQEGGIA